MSVENPANPAVVGDVLAYQWGYDQTNVDWFQVTKVTPKGVEVRPIAGRYRETGFMSGETRPARDAFTGDPFRKRVCTYRTSEGRYYLSMDYGVAILWDGRPLYESHYA